MFNEIIICSMKLWYVQWNYDMVNDFMITSKWNYDMFNEIMSCSMTLWYGQWNNDMFNEIMICSMI